MPTHEQEERAEFVRKLRSWADEADGAAPVGTATAIRGAADEVEALGKRVDEEYDAFQARLMKAVGDALRSFYEREALRGYEAIINTEVGSRGPRGHFEVTADAPPLLVKVICDHARYELD